MGITIDTEHCCDDARYIQSQINVIYYDTVYLDNSIQNNICHIRDIPNVAIYKNFNTLLSEEFVVRDINFLYFTAQTIVKMQLTTGTTIDLECKEFYLYQPNQPFSFSLSPIGAGSSGTCTCHLHCIYATCTNSATSV